MPRPTLTTVYLVTLFFGNTTGAQAFLDVEKAKEFCIRKLFEGCKVSITQLPVEL